MKRTHNVTVDKRKREELQSANCLDVDTIADASVLSAVYDHFKQVQKHEPDFGTTPWYISQLEMVLEEHSKLVQSLKNEGFSDSTEDRANAYLKQLLKNYDSATKLGFSQVPWKILDLNTFNETWRNLFDQLLSLGFQPEISTSSATCAASSSLSSTTSATSTLTTTVDITLDQIKDILSGLVDVSPKEDRYCLYMFHMGMTPADFTVQKYDFC
jgi:hypothetical protein